MDWTRFALVLGIGQLVSLAITGTAITSGAMVRLSLDERAQFPTFMAFLNSLLLFCVFALFRRLRPHTDYIELSDPDDTATETRLGMQQDHALRKEWWKYAVLAVCDLEGNTCLIFAYR